VCKEKEGKRGEGGEERERRSGGNGRGKIVRGVGEKG
jgi:hypothetical protein